MSHSLDAIRQYPAPTVKRLLREAGYSLSAVARIKPAVSQSLVTRVIRRQTTSARVLARIARCINNPRPPARIAS